jgi:Mn2+/Fe2+ NRAMP family transporter
MWKSREFLKIGGAMTAQSKAGKSKPFWHYLGPGIVSGASDNDPTTVASLAVIGSTTVYGLGWLVILIIPMLAVVQVISARVGAITRRGLEADAENLLGRVTALIMLVSVVSVTIVTLVADLEGGGASMQVLTGVDYRWWIVPIAAASLGMLIFGSYDRVKQVLLIFPLAFLGYPISALLARPDWHAVLIGTFVPHFERTQDYASGVIALLGTTLTAYAYVWQAVETAKERPPIKRLGLVQVDATFGTIVAGLSFWAIVIATGATLGIHHVTVETADQAAIALEPLAGHYARLLFGFGLLGSALLAVPVLIATSAYMLKETFGWHVSLDAKWSRARRFYEAMILTTVIAAFAAFLGIPPIKMLFVASILGGVGTPVSLVIMLLIARSKQVMGRHAIGGTLAIAGWSVAGIVILATGVFFASLFW